MAYADFIFDLRPQKGNQSQSAKEMRIRMIVAGIDIGAKNVRLVIMQDGKVVANGEALTGLKKSATAKKVYDST